jgi:putative transposase
MANTYTQIHIQFVFAVKNRKAVIDSAWEDELYKYITGIFKNYDHKMLAINGMPDHIHIFGGIRPKQSLSNLMQEVKQSSSKWINDNKLTLSKFEWQGGFAAFSYSISDISNVINYIERQKEHHKKHSFNEEYKELLDLFEEDYRDIYIFKELE